MKYGIYTRWILLFVTAVTSFGGMQHVNAVQASKPNVILILADDYGWTDLSCYGSDLYRTPNLDRLAQDGVKFEQAYSACTVCSPSRAAIMTGKYPARLHVTDWIPGLPPENPRLLVPDWTKYLPLEEVSLGRAFHSAGYVAASIGKWHLGSEEYFPDKHGFDINIGGTAAASPATYFAPYKISTLLEGPEGEYLTDRLGQEAVRFIEQNKDKPFFLYMPHFAVHLPIQAKKAIIQKYRARRHAGQTHTNELYAAMIESMDDTVGLIRSKLDELKLSDRTMIVFTSDNGGRVPTTSNLPLRVGKGSCYEGGTRVPMMVYWPGVTKAGTVCQTPVIGMDVYPTVLEIAGLTQAAQAGIDGVSLVPLLRQTGEVKRDALYWHYPHYQHYQLGGTTPYGAIRLGDFKLIEFYDDMRVELYDLRRDIGETNNLASAMPGKVAELRDRLHQWRKDVGAQMPTKNPNYDPSRPEHTPKLKKQGISFVREKVASVIPNKQHAQVVDRVHLNGWIGTRIDVNQSNRLAQLDPDRLLEGYRARPGRHKWDGEHLGKWMHAATLAWANSGDPVLRTKLDYAVSELMKCQLPDGYLGTYAETNRWTEWDIWSHKYNLLGLITYIRYTGNTDPLPTCKRIGDLLCNTFGDEPGKRDIITAGQHMGMAPTSVLEPMVLLYRLTGEPRYLDFCKYILRAWEQPNGPKIISTLLKTRSVVKCGNGKAYEMLSCLNGVLEYYRVVGDRDLFEACLLAWKDIVDNRLYPTGAASYREFFHENHDFPNVNNVGETCVTVTWLQFNAQLLRLTGEARFAEQLERVVLNQLFGAQCLDGSAWGYYVQMEGKKPYNGTLDGHCCLSSGPRGIAQIPSFAVTTDADGVVVNLYEAGLAQLDLDDGNLVSVVTETSYPKDGNIKISLNPAEKKPFAVKLRIPAWCEHASLQVNGKDLPIKTGPDGYLSVRRPWKKGDEIRLTLELKPRVIVGSHKNENKVAICFGPLVLAADEALIESGQGIYDVGVPAPDLAKLGIVPTPATGKFKSWPGAQVFQINAVTRKASGALPAGSPSKVSLIPFADAGGTGSAYRVWIPYGQMRPDRNVLLDGIEFRSRKPNNGSIIDENFDQCVTTFNAKRAAEDWYSVDLLEPLTIAKVVFVHGRTFHDGGWFDTKAGKPRVEIKKTATGDWEPVCVLEKYPETTAVNPGGLKGGERIECNLAHPIEIHGLRVVGKPACGDNPKQAFSSCAELQAFGVQK